MLAPVTPLLLLQRVVSAQKQARSGRAGFFQAKTECFCTAIEGVLGASGLEDQGQDSISKVLIGAGITAEGKGSTGWKYVFKAVGSCQDCIKKDVQVRSLGMAKLCGGGSINRERGSRY